MKDFLAHAEEAGSGWGGLAYQAMLTSATNTDDESLVIDEKLNTINDLINTGGIHCPQWTRTVRMHSSGETRNQ